MSLEVILSSALFGCSIALLVWAGEPSFRRLLDWIEADHREKLKKLRVYPRHLRATIVVWWAFVTAHLLTMALVFDIPVIGLLLSLLLLLMPWYLLRRWTEWKAKG